MAASSEEAEHGSSRIGDRHVERLRPNDGGRTRRGRTDRLCLHARDTGGKNAATVEGIADEAKNKSVDLRTVELDVQDEESIGAAIRTIVDEHGHLDVLVHSAGHMVWGPTEAFTPEQLAAQYDMNVLGAHRVNRAVLPHMREARSGLLV